MIYIIWAAIIWGSSFPVIKYTLDSISPLLFVVLRFFIAFLILIPWIKNFSILKNLFNRDIIFLSLLNTLGLILQFKAQEITTASKTALFINTSPLFIAIIMRERGYRFVKNGKNPVGPWEWG